jgi:hypothetical protein
MMLLAWVRGRYFFEGVIEFTFVCVDYSFEVGLVLIVFGIEVEDDPRELRHLLAHLVVQLGRTLVHFC